MASLRISPLSQSLQDRISDVIARPEPGIVFKLDVPFWMIFCGKFAGMTGGIMAIFLGVADCDVILIGNVEVIVARIWQIVAGFIVFCCEVPPCKKLEKLNDMVEQRPLWNRALAYVALAVPPILLDIGGFTFVGNVLIFTTGVIYGMMALVRKADRQDMATSPGMVGGGNIGNTDHHTIVVEDPDVWRPQRYIAGRPT